MAQSQTVIRPPAPQEARRTAVLWVAGVGASLLAAAAALFVAVRWNDLPPEGKLAVMVSVTAAFLAAGEALRRTLPTTGNVLFHLGALLVPVDIGAVNLRLGMSWQELLLVEGIVCTLFFGALGIVGRSKLLVFAAGLGVVATAFGIGATTAVPAPVALAVAAVAAAAVRPRSVVASVWAVTAGVMPVLVLSLDVLDAAPAALVQLGIAAADDPVFAIVTGALTAGVLLHAAHLTRDISLAWFGVGAVMVNGTSAWISSDLPRAADVVAPAAAFVLLQMIALATQTDPFWSRIGRWLANGAEVVAATFIIPTIAFVASAPVAESGLFGGEGFDAQPTRGIALAFLALGWSGSIVRHRLSSTERLLSALPALCSALCIVGAIEAATASTSATAITMVVVAAALLADRHPVTDAAAMLAAFYAPVTAHEHSLVAVLCAFGGATLLTVAARSAASRGNIGRASAHIIAAVAPLALGSYFIADLIDPRGAPLVFVAGCLAAGAALDAASRSVAVLARIASLGALIVVFFDWTADEKLLVGAPLLAALAIEAVRSSDRRIAFAAIAPLQFVVVHVALAADVDVAATGFVVAVAAVVWAGLSEVIGGTWRRPFELASATGLALGLVLSSSDPVAFGASLFVAGAVVAAAGVLHGWLPLAHAGGVAMTLGVWIELATADVKQLEAYAAPVALHLLIAGLYERSVRRPSSWSAHGPAIALLGGSALIERIDGGSGAHAVVAGAIGVLALIAGGSRRLAGPLVMGTAMLASVTVLESLAIMPTIPTWAWLAVAGSVLVSTAIALERAGTTPIGAGRRVVDVLQTTFE